MSEGKRRILIIDDTVEDRVVYEEYLREWEDLDVTTADGGARGLREALDGSFDCVFIDYVMPDMTGTQVLERYLAVRHDPDPVVMITGQGNERIAVQALKLGASDYVMKSGLTSSDLYRAFRNAIEKRKVERALMASQDDLRRAKQRAEEANMAKTTFLANMSHEIRTPLTAILGFTELLARGSYAGTERNEFARIVRRNGHTLMRIINDVLDLSKIEAGQLEVERIPVNLARLLGDVVLLFEGEARARGLILTGEWHEDLPEVIVTDPTRLRQILHNAINNAIKFTERGSVTLTVDSEMSLADRRARLSVRVRDTGVGISEEQRERIFSDFQQGDDSMTRRYGGTGLGLALCRKLAVALGGEFSLLESELGQGSIFELKMDVTVVAERKEPVATGDVDARHLRGARVLLLEDSIDSQLLIKHILSERGAVVETANNGVEGLDLLEQNDYDVVVTDLQMPIMDGLEAAQRMRQLGFRRPILGLSAHAFGDHRDRAIDKGLDDYLTKPIYIPELLAKLNGLLAARFEADRGAATTS